LFGLSLDLEPKLTATNIRRFLRHPAFRRWADRKGKVIRVRPNGICVWRMHAEEEEVIAWAT
jgi:hypothetical protein